MENILTCLILLPLIFAVATRFAPVAAAKGIAITGAVLTLLLSLSIVPAVTGMPGNGFVLETNVPWLPVLNIHYHIGVDAPAVSLILLTTFLTVCAVWYSASTITLRTNHYLTLLLVLEAVTIGAFMSLDLILFYLFFELCLIPVYFLIGIWGGHGDGDAHVTRRIAAANKFFVYTVVGSLLMLAAIIALYLHTGSFDYTVIHATLFQKGGFGVTSAALWIFAGFAIAFAVKTGLFPFHTWLPDAYAEAPTGAVMLLSGALAKLGTYGFFRFGITLFPEAAHVFAPAMVALGVISIIYGALVAVVQRDAKRVIAYSSVSHLGFVVVGLFSLSPIALTGALFQQVNHGITAGALFLIMGMIATRRGTTVIRDLGGLWGQMPLLGRFFLIAALSSIGLPLTNGFVGEFLILMGTFQNYPIAASLATTGVIWSAIYMLWMFQRVMYGPVSNPANRRLNDLKGFEIGVLVPFILLIFALGIRPGRALLTFAPAVQQTLSPMPPRGATPQPVALASMLER